MTLIALELGSVAGRKMSRLEVDRPDKGEGELLDFKPEDPSAKQATKRVVELERELARAVKRAERAEALVAVQKRWLRCWIR